MAGAASIAFFILLFFVAAACMQCSFVLSAQPSEADVLLSFRETLQDGKAALPNWKKEVKPCLDAYRANWKGIICNNSVVYGLQLENMTLSGMLDLRVLQHLPGLRAISFKNNSFTGPIPSLRKLPQLKAIYLSMNRFSGQIPDDEFDGMGSLRKVYLSMNEFTGPIPGSIFRATKLLELQLDGNGFTGRISDFNLPDVEVFNISSNNLEGPIPEALANNFDASAFAGNKKLCGAPLDIECPGAKSKKLSTVLLIAVIVIAILLFIGVILLVVLRCKRVEETDRLSRSSSNRKYEAYNPAKLEEGTATPDHYTGSGSGGKSKASSRDEQGKLLFVIEGRERFEMHDLLRSSAEILGSGNFGSSYKACLPSGTAVVVKRFKEMNRVCREDFQEHMRRLGRLSHPNLLPLVAYYYRKDEKLLVTDYIPYGSLALLLHGSRGSNLPLLDWSTRLKIVKGVASALAYLYDELPMLTLPHGHLKSSNVLLDENFEPILTDYALAPVMCKSHASQVMVAYKSPEYTQSSQVSKKSDVWSFGILILEILTGKFPANNLTQANAGTDLASWVNSVAREEWTENVFDTDMKGTKDAEGEILKLLQIALECCETNVDKRCDITQAISKIEELKVRDSDEGTTEDIEL